MKNQRKLKKKKSRRNMAFLNRKNYKLSQKEHERKLFNYYRSIGVPYEEAKEMSENYYKNLRRVK